MSGDLGSKFNRVRNIPRGWAHRPYRLDTSHFAMGQILPRIGALLICLLAGVAAAHAACRIEQRGVAPVELSDGHLLATVLVNGTPATFILDTGADRTLMSEQAVHQLGVARSGWVATTVMGLGGYEEHPDALPQSLRLGGVALRRRTLAADTSVTVGPLPVTEVAGHPIAGLLGRDFLAPFDLDMNLPMRTLTLYDVHGCGTGFLPWTTPYAAIPAMMPMDTAMVVWVLVDGRPLRALIDTGASASLIAAPGMFRLGLTAESLAHDPGGNGSGVGPNPVFMRQHRFAELRVGPVVTRDPMLWVAPAHVVPIVDMLLGADWLRSRHVWLSFATRQIFVAQP